MEKFKGSEETISKLKYELEATKMALEAESANPKIKGLERQVDESREAVKVLMHEKDDLEVRLSEAVKEYQIKNGELSTITEQIANLKNELTGKELYIWEQNNEVQECRALLDKANSLANEKQFLVEDRDAQIMRLEEKLENLKKEQEQKDNIRQMEKSAADQQLSEFRDKAMKALEKQKPLESLLEEKCKEHELLEK